MIDNKKRISKMSAEKYQEIFGIKKETFDKMLEILQIRYDKMHELGGKTPTLTVLDKLVIALQYWREYRTYRHIAFDYDVGKTAIGDSVKWVEDTLVADGSFSLPAKRTIEKYNDDIEIIVVDVTEQEVERPKRGRKDGIPARKSDTQ